MGLARKLMSGHLVFDHEASVLLVVRDGRHLEYRIPYETLTPIDWGYVYERHVGLTFEALGYAVTYRGLRLGFIDRGVDLVLQRGEETIYVQCKHAVVKPLNMSGIRWLLYEADRLLATQYRGQPLNFHLVVPSKNDCFGSTKLKINGVVRKQSISRYVEALNGLPSRVRIKVVEVPMLRHGSVVGDGS